MPNGGAVPRPRASGPAAVTLASVGFALATTLGIVAAICTLLGQVEATLPPERRRQLFHRLFPTRRPATGGEALSVYALPQRLIERVLDTDPSSWRFLVRSMILTLLVFAAFLAWVAYKLADHPEWETLAGTVIALHGRDLAIAFALFFVVNAIVDYLSMRQTFTLGRLVGQERRFGIYVFMSYADVALTITIWLAGTAVALFLLLTYVQATYAFEAPMVLTRETERPSSFAGDRTGGFHVQAHLLRTERERAADGALEAVGGEASRTRTYRLGRTTTSDLLVDHLADLENTRALRVHADLVDCADFPQAELRALGFGVAADGTVEVPGDPGSVHEVRCVVLRGAEPLRSFGTADRAALALAGTFNVPLLVLTSLQDVTALKPLNVVAAALAVDDTFAGQLLAATIRNDSLVDLTLYAVPIEPFFFSTFALTLLFQLAFVLAISLRLAYRATATVAAGIVEEIAEQHPLSAAFFLGVVPLSLVLFAAIVAFGSAG